MPSFESFDATKLAYDVDGDGPDVLLLHGYATDAYINWVRPGLVSRLNAAGYRTIALDLRGHGMSDKPHDPQAYADGALVRDAQALLDHLGVERCACIGYSLGSLTTLRMLTGGEARVRLAVLGGIGGDSIKPRGGGEAIADAMEAEDRTTITHPVAKSFRDFAELTRADRKALAALQRRRPEEIGDLRDVAVPVLVLVGDNDPMIGNAGELAERFSDAEVVVVGGSHLNVVNNPDFHAAVVSFLDGHRAVLETGG